MSPSPRRSCIAPEAVPAFDLSSLIDVSFLLLIYFLATSTLQPKEVDLGMKNGGEGSYEIDLLTIDITPQGEVKIAGDLIEDSAPKSELLELTDRLAFYKTTTELMGQKPVVVVNAADTTRCQRFVDVLNCVAGQRIENVTLANFTR